LNFTPVKFADLQASSNELIDDSNIDVRNILSTTMVRNLASAIDYGLINGAGGTTALKGLLASGSNTKTALGVAINLDALFDAYAAIEATGAIPTAILLSPDAAAVIRKSKASTAGTYLMGEPTAPACSRFVRVYQAGDFGVAVDGRPTCVDGRARPGSIATYLYGRCCRRARSSMI
jgi:HK97 family phage major capsid protein